MIILYRLPDIIRSGGFECCTLVLAVHHDLAKIRLQINNCSGQILCGSDDHFCGVGILLLFEHFIFVIQSV